MSLREGLNKTVAAAVCKFEIICLMDLMSDGSAYAFAQ